MEREANALHEACACVCASIASARAGIPQSYPSVGVAAVGEWNYHDLPGAVAVG